MILVTGCARNFDTLRGLYSHANNCYARRDICDRTRADRKLAEPTPQATAPLFGATADLL